MGTTLVQTMRVRSKILRKIFQLVLRDICKCNTSLAPYLLPAKTDIFGQYLIVIYSKGLFFFNFKGFLNMHLVSGFRLLAFIIQIVCNLAILLAK